MVKLSTIIRVYNDEQYLKDTLQSIVEKHEIDDRLFECILVDDESTDKSPDICKDYCQKYPYFKYIRIFSDGTNNPANALNNGLRYSSGEYIHFLKTGDLLQTTFYKDAVAVLSLTDMDLFIRGYRILDNAVWKIYEPSGFKYQMFGPPLGSCVFKNYIKAIKFDSVVSYDVIFTWFACHKRNYYYDGTNYNSVTVITENHKPVEWGSKLPYPQNIITYLQDNEEYPWMVVDGETRKKFNDDNVNRCQKTPTLNNVIITNNCVGGFIYRQLGQPNQHPFIWNTITYENFNILLDEYDNIDFAKFEVEPTILTNGLITVDDIFGVFIDNKKLCVKYIHHHQKDDCETLKVKGIDLFYCDMKSYVADIYQRRVNRFVSSERKEPIFVFTKSKYYTDEEFYKIVYKPTKYRKIVGIEYNQKVDLSKVPENTFIIPLPIVDDEIEDTAARSWFLIKNYPELWGIEYE